MDKPQQPKPLNDLSRSLTPLDVNHTLICVIEMGTESWLVGGIIPGVERQPLKRRRQGTRSTASPSPSRPAGTASG